MAESGATGEPRRVAVGDSGSAVEADRSSAVFSHPVLALLSAALVVCALYFGRELLIPLSLAIFFSFLLAPVVRLLERVRVPRVLSVLTVVGLFFTLVMAFGYLVGKQASGLVSDFPNYRSNIVAKLDSVRESFNATLGRASSFVGGITKEVNDRGATSKPESSGTTTAGHPATRPDGKASQTGTADEEAAPPVKVEVVKPRDDVLTVIGNVLGPVVHPLATVGATVVLAIFFLINRFDLRDRIIRLSGKAPIPITTAALSDAKRRVTRFLVAQVFANTATGTAIGLGLYAIGLPNAALWGLLAAVARFLPYVGTIIAALFPFTLAVALFDGWQVPIMVVAWCLVVDLISANALEPMLYGARTGVSPTAILLAFMFWTWIWGGVGLFLATPITVCLVALGKHVPALDFLYILLSDEPVLETQTRFYQRLLARDEAEARRIVEKAIEESSVIGAFDEIVFPALAQVERDRLAGLLDPEHVEIARRTAEHLLSFADLDEATDAEHEGAETAPEPRLTVACVPGRGSFDSLLIAFLKRIGRHEGFDVTGLSNEALASEVVSEIQDLQPRAVVIAAIEPRPAHRVRHLCKMIRSLRSPPRIYIAACCAIPRAGETVGRISRDLCGQPSTSVGAVVENLRRPTPPRPAPATVAATG